MKRILLLFTLCCVLSASATHIVGGELSYQHLGGSSYYLTVKLYKDCNPDVANFPSDVEVEAITGFGDDTLDFFILPRLGRDTLIPSVDTCAFDPGVCVEEAIYGGIVSLPPVVGGYHLFYQTYARNGSILNIVDPLMAGESFYAYVPNNKIYLTNSSPVFSVSPPVFVCQGYELDLDFSATDIDGDSLAYSFYTPYTGRTWDHPDHYDPLLYYPTVDEDGTPPDNITFPEVVWVAGFDASNPLNAISGDALSISTDGLITGVPDALGQYVIGVMVEEYRDGEKIGEIVRDFQLNVVSCPPPNDASIGVVDGCDGLTITFPNESGLGASDFWWDFGTGNPADTSIVDEPTFDFSSYGYGAYTITLIAEKGSNCADTAYYDLILSTISADFTTEDTVCTLAPVAFDDLSTIAGPVTLDSWTWNFGDGETSTEQNPIHFYESAGDYTVELIVVSSAGCTDTITKMIHIKNPPGAGIMPMMGCVGLDVTFSNTSAAAASGFHWDFGTGNPADTSILENPSFTFPDYGVYTITLIAQKGTFCADTATYNLMISNATADFEALDTTCTDVLIDFTDLSTSNNGSINTWEWNFGDDSFSTEQFPSHGYSAPGDYEVTLVVGSTIGCTDTVTKTIHIDTAPEAIIGTADYCSGLSIDFVNNSSPEATDFWWDFGTGDVADTSIVENPSFTYGSYGTYTVTLVAQKGTSCETETSVDIVLSNIIAAIDHADSVCLSSEVDFVDLSSTVDGATLTEWSWDFGDLSTSDLQNPSHVFTEPGDFIIEFVVTNSVGCVDTLYSDIYIQDTPIANAGIDTSVCLGDPGYMLNGSILNAESGTWSGGAGGVFSPSETDLNATYFPVLDELTLGETTLFLTTEGNGFCEADVDTIVISYLSSPEVIAGDDIDVCIDSTFIDITATLGFESNTTWSTLGDGVFGDEEALETTYTFGPDDIDAGIVTLVIETYNFAGCPNNEDTLVVHINPFPVIAATNDTVICFGFPLALDSESSTGSGLWSTSGDGTFDPIEGTSTIYEHGLIDGFGDEFSIYFETTNNGGCPAAYDTVTVSIIPTPIPDFSFTEVCFGEETEFVNLSTSVDPISDYFWDFSNDATTTDESPTHNFSNAGDYEVSLVVLSESGCSDTVTYSVTSHAIPVADFVVPTPCLEGGTAFIDSSAVANDTIATWSWDFGDNSAAATIQNPVHDYSVFGTYEVNLTVSSGFGCVHDTLIAVTVNQGPLAKFSANPASVNLFVDINFIDQSIENEAPITDWQWDFNDGDSSAIQNPIHQYSLEGEYDVSLIVTDEFGCSDTAIVMVPIYHGPLIPSGFSPNGDGTNDVLMLLGGNFSEVDFKIYNNWGEIVFETTDVNSDGWDGTYKEEPQPLGVYVYVARVVTYDGVEHLLSGDVSLIR
jgi:gliding motility-associated-like protein